MKQRDIEVALNTLLKEVQELKERVNTLERHMGYRSDTTTEITKIGTEMVERKEK